MNQRNQLFKCELCGNIVEMTHPSAGTLVCCGQEMSKIVENTVEAAKEKHIPVISKIDGGFKIVVGEVLHPMTEAHLIEWIDLITPDKTYRKFLKAGEEPQAIFLTEASKITARAYCNLHGNWKSEN